MNPETVELLKGLAGQLGTTTEFLWGALIKQAFIDGMQNIVLVPVLIASAFLAFRYGFVPMHKKALKMRAEKEYSDWDLLYVPAGLSILGSIIVCGIAISCIFDAMTAFMNPEYWALRQLLDKIQK